MRDHFSDGLKLFNAERFFDAHEAWETIWLESRGEEKRFLQGLIQLAAAFHHFQRGNLEGAQSLMEEGASKLRHFGPIHRGLNLENLLADLVPWQGFLQSGPQKPGREAPPFPFLQN